MNSFSAYRYTGEVIAVGDEALPKPPGASNRIIKIEKFKKNLLIPGVKMEYYPYKIIVF